MSEQRIEANGNVCPFIHSHYEECYCNSLHSQDIERIISFCGGGFRLCQVYQGKLSPEEVMKTVECAQEIF